MKNPALAPRVIRFGVFEFSPQTGELRKHGLKVKFEPQASKILLVLLNIRERYARDKNSSNICGRTILSLTSSAASTRAYILFAGPWETLPPLPATSKQ